MIAYIAATHKDAIDILRATLPDHSVDHNGMVWSPARMAPIGVIVWDQHRLLGLELSGFVDLDGTAAHNVDLRSVLLARIFRACFSDHMRANMRRNIDIRMIPQEAAKAKRVEQ